MELNELRIKSLGIIDEIGWQPGRGLNIITGETGAGKSLIVDALDILFFSKADECTVRHGDSQAVVEAYFSLESFIPESIFNILKEKRIEYDEDGLIMQAQIKQQGRSTYRINATPVPRSTMSQIGQALLDMHTQAQHLTLFNPDNHLDILDSFGEIGEYRKQFSAKLASLRQLENTRNKLEKEAGETERKRDFIAYQVEELTRAELKSGEDDGLEKELQTLSSVEKINELGQRLHLVLTGGIETDSLSALDCCGQGLELCSQLYLLDDYFSSVLQELEKINASLEDLGIQISRYIDSIDTSGARLEEVESRLEVLKTLKKKYGMSIDELIIYREEMQKELENLESIPANLEEIEARITGMKTEMAKLASAMHDSRKTAGEKLAESVNAELAELDMNGVNFSVLLEKEYDEQNGLPVNADLKLSYDKTGTDRVIFTASTNPGEPLKPLQNVASTGEASRFTLAVKNALAQADSVPVLIFDEIDIGVGGRSGEVIGKKLWALARHHQVICITHLPQIAAFADNHYRVIKVSDGDRNTSRIDLLDDDDRLKELAEMLSSRDYSHEAMQTATQLYYKSAEWKSKQNK